MDIMLALFLILFIIFMTQSEGIKGLLIGIFLGGIINFVASIIGGLISTKFITISFLLINSGIVWLIIDDFKKKKQVSNHSSYNAINSNYVQTHNVNEEESIQENITEHETHESTDEKIIDNKEKTEEGPSQIVFDSKIQNPELMEGWSSRAGSRYIVFDSFGSYFGITEGQSYLIHAHCMENAPRSTIHNQFYYIRNDNDEFVWVPIENFGSKVD